MRVDKKWLNKETGKYKCPYCEKEYSKKGISTHIMRKHTDKEKFSNSGTKGLSWTLGEDYVSPRTLLKQKEQGNKTLRKMWKNTR